MRFNSGLGGLVKRRDVTQGTLRLWWLAAAAFVVVTASIMVWPFAPGDVEQEQTPLPGIEAMTPAETPVQANSEQLVKLDVIESKPYFRDEIQRELAHVDPEVDGWDTESINDAASAILKKVGQYLAAVVQGETPDVAKLPVGTFAASTLLPAELPEVYRDDVVTVRRWTGQAPQLQQVDFETTVLQLVSPWKENAADFRTAFKIIRVSMEGQRAATLVKAQLSGQTSGRRIQHNAYWLCRWQRNETAPKLQLRSIQLSRLEEVVTNQPETLLTDCTEAVLGQTDSFREQFSHGIDYWRDRLDWRLGVDFAGPHGLAVGDVNGDDLPDLFVCESGGLPNRLFVQNADGTARDISEIAGIDWLEPATSALLVDMDNDGDQDLLFTSGRFFVSCENNGDATFELQNVESMTGVARSLSAADFDGDGRLDVYVCCYLQREATLDDVGMGMPMPYHDANNGPANVCFRNLGDWKYTDVTDAVGLGQNNQKFSYAAAWEDYDNDGDLDLYVANDFGRNNLYQNTNGQFRDVAAEAGVEDIATGMSVSWADYNRDGHMDLYVGNMFSTAGNRVMYQRRFQSETDEATRDVFRRLARGNSLFVNNGDGTFRDVSETAGVTFGRWAWASMFMDLNNDGWEDIVVGNGMITSEEDTGDL